MKKSKLLALATLAFCGVGSSVAQTDVTSQYLINPSFELSAEGTAAVAEDVNNAEFYGWTLPNLGTSFVNRSIGSKTECNGQAFGVSNAKEGNVYYFNRRGWNSNASADGTLSTTTKELPKGVYTLSIAYKGLDSYDNSHNTKGSNLTLSIKQNGIELASKKSANFENVNGNSAGAGKFTGDANWKELSVEFPISDEGPVTVDIIEHMIGGVRTDIVIDNITLAVNKYATQGDYDALASAIAAVESKTLGFEEGEYAPYVNVDAIKALAEAKKINQKADNAQVTVQAITAALASATWTVNADEVNAIYDGVFSKTTAKSGDYLVPTGWTNLGYNTRVYNQTNKGTNNGIDAGSEGGCLFAKFTTTYGEVAGYEMPLKAGAYSLSFIYGGWNEVGTREIKVYKADDNSVAATVTPANVTAKNNQAHVSTDAWSSYNGIVTIPSDGNYVLSFYRQSTTAQNQICVSDIKLVKAILPTSVSLDKTSVELEPNETVTLVPTIAPADASIQTVTWTTSDDKVATVENGVVTAVAEGEATITATCGDVKATATIKVKAEEMAIKPTAITLNATSADLKPGQQTTLAVTKVTPDNATETVTWSSSDDKVATVKDGVVTAVGEGTATITATSTVDENIKATASVTVAYPTELANASFDEADVATADLGTNGSAANTMAVSDWTSKGGVWTAGAAFAYGNAAKLNSADIPAADETHKGNALGVSAGWGAEVVFSQTIKLLAGNYTVSVDAYNAGSAAQGASKLGFVAANGTSYISDKNSYTIGEWETDKVTFKLTEATVGQIQIGLGAISGGSGANAKVFFDNIVITTKTDAEIEAELAAEAAKALAEAKDAKKAAINALAPIGNEIFKYSKASIDAALANVDAATTKDAVEAVAIPTQNKPATTKAYMISLKENGLYLTVTSEGIILSETQQPLFFDGNFTIGNEKGEYVAYTGTGSNKWSLGARPEGDQLAVTISNGAYTLKGKNGFFGVNSKDAGSSVFGDKAATEWVIAEYVAPVIAATEVSLDKTSVELEIGESVTLKATVAPDETTDKTVTWTTNNDKVATVVNGVVTAKGEGIATITATCGDVNATATITVAAPEPEIAELTDGERHDAQDADAVEYTRNFANTEWQGLVVPFDINVKDNPDCTFAVLDVEGSDAHEEDGDYIVSLKFNKKIDVVEAGTPALVKANSIGINVIKGTGSVVAPANKSNDMGNGFSIVGLMESTVVMKPNFYAMAGGALCNTLASNVELPINRWYLAIPAGEGGAKARIRIEGLDDVTAIDAITNAASSEKVYTISGVEVDGSNLRPGMYIQNGKKVIRK